MQRSCENCFHFKLGTLNNQIGDCRRYAPRPEFEPAVQDCYRRRVWPLVERADWCGEFTPTLEFMKWQNSGALDKPK